MSDRSVLQRFAPKVGSGPGASSVVTDPGGTDDLGAFGWLRGIRDRAVMLELRKKDGDILAVGYGYLDHAEFSPSAGVTLSVAGRKIHVRGRNLNTEVRPMVRLFEGITRHRVPWIQEADRGWSLESGNADTVVEAISW